MTRNCYFSGLATGFQPMSKQSAGILVHRFINDHIEVLLVHPGGPFYAKKDNGVWSIPKGEFTSETPFDAALREFYEETGFAVSGDFLPLTPIKQKNGKTVFAWAVTADLDPATIRSNSFSIEWPPHSGKMQDYPEIDKAAWFTIAEAKQKIIPAQIAFLDELGTIIP